MHEFCEISTWRRCDVVRVPLTATASWPRHCCSERPFPRFLFLFSRVTFWGPIRQCRLMVIVPGYGCKEVEGRDAKQGRETLWKSEICNMILTWQMWIFVHLYQCRSEGSSRAVARVGHRQWNARRSAVECKRVHFLRFSVRWTRSSSTPAPGRSRHGLFQLSNRLPCPPTELSERWPKRDNNRKRFLQVIFPFWTPIFFFFFFLNTSRVFCSQLQSLSVVRFTFRKVDESLTTACPLKGQKDMHSRNPCWDTPSANLLVVRRFSFASRISGPAYYCPTAPCFLPFPLVLREHIQFLFRSTVRPLNAFKFSSSLHEAAGETCSNWNAMFERLLCTSLQLVQVLVWATVTRRPGRNCTASQNFLFRSDIWTRLELRTRPLPILDDHFLEELLVVHVQQKQTSSFKRKMVTSLNAFRHPGSIHKCSPAVEAVVSRVSCRWFSRWTSDAF